MDTQLQQRIYIELMWAKCVADDGDTMVIMLREWLAGKEQHSFECGLGI